MSISRISTANYMREEEETLLNRQYLRNIKAESINRSTNAYVANVTRMDLVYCSYMYLVIFFERGEILSSLYVSDFFLSLFCYTLR